MHVYNRLLSLGLLLGLMAALGWVFRPQSRSQTAAQARSASIPTAASAVPQAPALPRQPAAAGERRFQVQLTATSTRTPTPINIGNFVWNDLDGDGVQDAGEPGLNGVTVQLWNAAKTQLIAQAVTNASGLYAVVAPLPGNYRVRVILPGVGATFTLKDQGGDNLKDSDINPSGVDAGFTDIFNLAPNLISITTIDAGIRPAPGTPTPTRTPTPINIGNFVWNDLDSDGVQDVGEPGLNGVTVQLWNAAKTQLINQAVTNASGLYAVVAPLPGDYRVRVILPGGGATFSPKDQGGDNLKDSDINPSGVDAGFTDIFNLAPNLISITTIDAGLRSVAATPTMTATPAFGSLKVYLPLLVR